MTPVQRYGTSADGRPFLQNYASGSTITLVKKGKGSLYSITEHRVPELIPVLGSQPAGDASHNPPVGCHYFPPNPQLP